MHSTSSIPKPSEACEDFCIRAHKELMQTIPVASDRNQMVWNAWEMSRGSFSVERYRAQGKFSGYRVIPDVCHFAEHTTGTKSGPMKVGENDISAICKNMNRRISDVGLYPPLIDRHTTDNPNDHQRGILGYAGNYKIGMIGDSEVQRYAIFGDEFHKPEHLQQLNDKPRRSVELMRYKDSARNFFDPIACLGAESPRIEIPPAYYSIEHDESGVEVVRYSVASPVYAGASNTYVPSFDQEEKERLQAAGEPNTEKTKVLDPNDLTQVVDAVKNALQPYLQYLDTQMQQNMGGGNGPDALSLGDQGTLPGSPAAPAQGQPPSPAHQPPVVPSQPKPPEQYMHGQQPMRYEASEDEEVEKERYAALEKKYVEVIAECGQLKTRLGALETERTDAIRSHRLHELCSRFNGVVDFDDEASKVLYSSGAEVSDDEFEGRLEMIERYASLAVPPVGMVPEGVSEDDGDDRPIAKDRYSARVQNEVVRRITEAVSTGKVLDYNTVEGEVCKEFGIE
jgi:hypothetical protein